MDPALRQRLLGGAVLVALAIIFVPMFLGNAPPKPDSAIQNLDIPPLPEHKFETRTLAVEPRQVLRRQGRPIEQAPDGRHESATDVQAPDTDKNAKAPASADRARESCRPRSKPAAGWKPSPRGRGQTAIRRDARLLRVGGSASISVSTLIRRMPDALIAGPKLGFVAYSESTEYQGKSAQRVRAGPFADRAAAEAARLKIKQAEPKAPSSVTESAEAQPAADAPATAVAANRAGGWAVQLGAFKSEAEANKLRDRVRTVSIASFVDRSGTGDETLWRVRAGPYADRAGAESARATLKQKLQTDGMIVTQP